jgi:hypothetical protein
VALDSPAPSAPTEWGADQKNGQNNQRRKHQRKKKSRKKPAPAIYAADTSQGADNHVKD